MELQIDIVSFSGGDPIVGLYINGKLEMGGDYYHDKIEETIEGFLAGLTYAEVDWFRQDHELTEENQDKFAEEGYEIPEEFPNKWAGQEVKKPKKKKKKAT